LCEWRVPVRRRSDPRQGPASARSSAKHSGRPKDTWKLLRRQTPAPVSGRQTTFSPR
jgi:hypothetical protein